MSFIVGLVAVSLATVAVIAISRASSGRTNAALGWMSEQWLAEHRASHAE